MAKRIRVTVGEIVAEGELCHRCPGRYSSRVGSSAYHRAGGRKGNWRIVGMRRTWIPRRLIHTFPRNFLNAMRCLIYNTLVAYDKGFNIVPDLAASWEIGDEGKSITFHLQPGVKFHDGTECDAAAVKWNLDRVVDPAVNSPLRGQLQPPLEKVDAIDKMTVKLTTSIPWRPLLAALGERPGFIVSPTAAHKSGQDFGRNPVGSGPFKFVEWVPDSHITVERFTDYWEKGKPRLDRIDIRHVPDAQVQLGMIRTSEAHLIDSAVPSALQTLKGVQGVTVEELKSGRFWGTQCHSDIPPFNNSDPRKAVAYATDRESVRRVAFGATGRLSTHPLGGGWAYNSQLDNEGYTFDLDKAKEALARSGAGSLSLTFTNSNDRLTQDVAQVLQASYAKVGMSVPLESVPAADSRYARSLMMQVLQQDYVRTARAKGLPGSIVLRRHAARNALIPLVTLVGVELAGLFGGAVVTETVFSLPGVGLLLTDSVLGKDLPMVQPIVLFLTVAVVFTSFVVDLMYGVLDPRVRVAHG